MFNIDNMRVDIHVELEPGLYVLEPLSSTGKTRLCKLLKEYSKVRDDVLGVTYDDFKEGYSPVFTQDLRLVILDRYDMYAGYEIPVEEYPNIIFLVDSKRDYEKLNEAKDCILFMKEDCIEVWNP